MQSSIPTKKGTSKRESEYSVEREGAGQVVLVGAPNVGKSSLVASLTNAQPEIADFPHSTWKPTPGMMVFENIQFQLVDTPPISKDFVDSWMIDLLRRADMLMVVVDLHCGTLQQLDDSLAILQELRIYAEGSPVPDGLTKTPFFKKLLIVVNKMDTADDEEDFAVFLELSEITLPAIGLSASTGRNLPALPRKIYELSDIIRIYTKAPGSKSSDRGVPFVLPQQSTLENLAAKIHKDFAAHLKYAKVWGQGVHDGQMVHRDYVLHDGDVVEIHL
ncbi:GTPase [Desulfoferrobacter suflitae]|uniref:GTPase n=1 Tax=Desulfoferrobacter suflitae TaxID=2865782 RepID=UPI0021644420|nr:GTPase [Desulfoferrobacter suflitae]MCK8604179.1 50S ribosome-binding GTPase [Desulfoferrobacter suflitae]